MVQNEPKYSVDALSRSFNFFSDKMTVSNTPADRLSTLEHLAIYLCRLYFVITFGLGCSSIILLDIRSIILITIILVMIYIRLKKGTTLSFISDELLVSLPYFWAMNAVWVFNPWRLEVTLLFCISFGCACLFLLIETKKFGYNLSGQTYGIICAFIFFIVFMTLLKFLFPLFTIENYKFLVFSALLFFGGIPICKVAWFGIAFCKVQSFLDKVKY